jgi:membrane-bound lytic murein transglycosylase MltF
MNAYHTSNEFLEDARKVAQRRGYDPDKLSLATDRVHKLTYDSPQGIRHFGRRGYGDFLYYSKYEPDIANRKRMVFRRSHGAISRIHQLDKYSPNELAINILW